MDAVQYLFMRSIVSIVLFGSMSLLAYPQTPPKIVSSIKSGSSSTAKTPDEKAEWQRISAIEKPGDRAAAVRAFITSFPDSALRAQARDLLVTSEVEEGNLGLQSGNTVAAVERFVAAATDAPKPVDDHLFEVLSELPANLYFRGAREQGIRIAEILEEKSETSAEQNLILANFYLSVENGSKARQLADRAIKIKPESPAAYQALGLAYRMDFQLEESAAAYQRALELDPDSDLARRGLAEMKRSLGKSDEAIILYSTILEKDAENLPARSGLILSLFGAGKRVEAEAELAKSLSENPGNIILLSGAAYWYAAHGEGEKAIEFARKAIDTDPRYIWSHIALARGLLLLGKPFEAEKTLLAARRYGNFPTLEYEISSTRLAAGFFRDAAEELAKSFVINEGSVRTKLGGRILRDSSRFADLLGLERRASIFEPAAADTEENAAKLFELLELKQALDAPRSDTQTVVKAVDQFVQGDDAMKLHRQLYVAGILLDRRIELTRAADLAQSAIANVEAGIAAPNASAAVLASELYENRAIAVARGEYLSVPEVPRSTLSAIVRGRIEEINGWAKYQMDDPEGAAVRLKRAVSVFPPNSAWWQSASWRLGSALALSGKNEEALEAYVRTYKASGQQDTFRYETIASLYRTIHGNTGDLESLIGPDPSNPKTVAEKAVPAGEITLEANTKETRRSEAFSPPSVVPIAATPTESQTTPSPMPEAPVKVDKHPAPLPVPEPEEVPEADTSKPASETPVEKAVSAEKTKIDEASGSAARNTNIFSPVVITIPSPQVRKTAVTKAIPYLPNPVPKSTKDNLGTAEIRGDPPDVQIPNPDEILTNPSSQGSTVGTAVPCTITASDENLTLLSDSGGRAVIVSIDDDTDLEAIKGISSSPENVSVRRESIPGIKSRALFVVRSENSKPGVYQVTFELPCGKKVIVVRVG